MSSQGLASGLWEAFLNWAYSSGGITIPEDFHSRCAKINDMLDNDVSGIVSTITGYSINSCSEAILKVECSDDTLENLFNLWLSKININIDGVPSGLNELAKEYYKERWEGSSLCLMRVGNWETISNGSTSIKVPTLMYFVNGASIYIERKNTANFKPGTDKYYLDEKKKFPIPKNEKEKIFIQKPFGRIFTEYPSPYLVRNGALKNWLAMEVLASKGDEALSKVLPYLFVISKGDKDVFLRKSVSYDDIELQKLVNNFKAGLEKYKNEKGKIPANAIPFDQKYEHLIPDLLPILKEELYRQGYRAILSGLGFIDLLEITPSRQETRLNPKPFIAEVNAGISDFKSMLMDVVRLIISENKIEHRKLFSDKNYLKITNSQLKINVQAILDQLRSAFIYGGITIETYHESLQIDHEQELERMKKEWENGLRELFYPHVTQNQEDKGIDTKISPVPITKKQTEKQKEKEKAEIEVEIEEATLIECKKCGYEFILEDVPEAGMGYVKCPICEEPLTQKDEKAKIEETKNYYRVRQLDPSKFEKKSFRIIWLSKSQGIKAVIGRLKGEKTTTIQSLLFQKDKWSPEKIKEWIKKHEQFHAYIDAIESNLEDLLEIAPYKNVKELLKKHPYMKKYPNGALEVFIEVFNKSLPKGEDYAFPVAYTAMKRWLKKHGYKKVGDKWVKSEDAE